MDLTEILSDFVDDILGAGGEYALNDLHEVTAAEAASVIRLRIALYQSLIADGWTPPAGVAEHLQSDDALLHVPDDSLAIAPSREEDFATIRARATLARREALDRRQDAEQQRESARDLAAEVQQMRQAMESRATIEQAKGIVMERFRIAQDVAWSWLVRTSQQRNVKLRAIAQELVDSVAHAGSPPGPEGQGAPKAAHPSPADVPRRASLAVDGQSGGHSPSA